MRFLSGFMVSQGTLLQRKPEKTLEKGSQPVTKPLLKPRKPRTHEPASGLGDTTQLDVCVFPEGSSNHEGVGVYIRTLEVDIDEFLRRAQDLESKIFPGRIPKEVRDKLVTNLLPLRPVRNDEMQGGKYLALRYDLDVRKEVYDAVKSLDFPNL